MSNRKAEYFLPNTGEDAEDTGAGSFECLAGRMSCDGAATPFE
jgi:hypothetical protein